MTASERLCKPLRATPDDLTRVQDAAIEVMDAAQLGDTMQFGLAGSPTWVEAIESIEPPRKKIIRQASDGIGTVVRETLADLIGEGLFGEWRLETHQTILPGTLRNNPDKSFWVVAEIIENEIRHVTFEMLGRAVELAQASGGETAVLVIGADVRRHVDALAAHGADKIYVAEHPALGQYTTEPYARIVNDAIVQYKPFAVLAASTANGRDLMPRTAAKQNLGLTGDVIALNLDEQGRLVQLKPAFGGNIVAPILSKTLPAMATVRPGMLVPAQPDASRRGQVIELTVGDVTSRVTFVSSERTTDEGVHLDDAEIVIGVGVGVGGAENLPVVEELCRALDAHMGATRKVVDQGWMPRQLQIGLTGRSISPHLFVALGIRGAFNHTVGIQRAGIIFAVNTDPNADIFKQCDYGIVGDWRAVVAELLISIEELRK